MVNSLNDLENREYIIIIIFKLGRYDGSGVKEDIRNFLFNHRLLGMVNENILLIC